jgi:HSP20 family protein
MPDGKKSENSHDWLEDEDDGQLAVDVIQKDDQIVIVAPIAGVKKEDLDIAISEEMVSIKGVRRSPSDAGHDHYLIQECYWGPFSRNYILPATVNSDEARAVLKDGLLTITIPRDLKSRAKSIEISDE